MRAAILALLLTAVTTLLPAATTNNDDSCDIGVYPAATLLLPYFEVDINAAPGAGTDTLFTVINTSQQPQIARATIWTDLGFPVLTFTIFLTGYDQQAISLRDVLLAGVIAPRDPALVSGGTSSTTPPGPYSSASNPRLTLTNCDHLPGFIPAPFRAAVATALTTGIYNAAGFSFGCGTTQVGQSAAHHPSPTTAVGYITIDVVSDCTVNIPTMAGYYDQDLLYDNVLSGDYQMLDPISQHANGGPLVHIRAVPEGGAAGVVEATPFAHTFYQKLNNGRTFDRRQPLPATFAAHYLESSGVGTRLTVWRQPLTSGAAACGDYLGNSSMGLATIVRFDEHENANILANSPLADPPQLFTVFLPPSSRRPTTGIDFPPLLSVSGDTGGWLYLDLRSQQAQQQNWATYTIAVDHSFYSVEATALSLGNGCTPAGAIDRINGDFPSPAIGPAPNVNP
jgi:hypothetical protein